MNDQSDIGEELKKARQRRALSLEDVARKTHIPLATLKGLEEGDYSNSTSSAYTKSFLSQYSDFLRIDADEVVENFNTGNIVTEPDHIKFLTQKNSPSHQPTVSSRPSLNIKRLPQPSSSLKTMINNF